MHVKKGMVRLQGKKENEYKFESKRRTKSNTKKERKGEKNTNILMLVSI